ncbi:hypothetical protein [Dubosiella newyorkensis]|uniref:hypothetical protein n=1 Tax=Dubosiella newyorkensis TaxID=1862672 RepID=UPI003F680419
MITNFVTIQIWIDKTRSLVDLAFGGLGVLFIVYGKNFLRRCRINLYFAAKVDAKLSDWRYLLVCYVSRILHADSRGQSRS